MSLQMLSSIHPEVWDVEPLSPASLVICCTPWCVSFIGIAQVQVVSGSVPLKVSEALCAAEDTVDSFQDLLQREETISNLLEQVTTIAVQH